MRRDTSTHIWISGLLFSSGLLNFLLSRKTDEPGNFLQFTRFEAFPFLFEPKFPSQKNITSCFKRPLHVPSCVALHRQANLVQIWGLFSTKLPERPPQSGQSPSAKVVHGCQLANGVFPLGNGRDGTAIFTPHGMARRELVRGRLAVGDPSNKS